MILSNGVPRSHPASLLQKLQTQGGCCDLGLCHLTINIITHPGPAANLAVDLSHESIMDASILPMESVSFVDTICCAGHFLRLIQTRDIRWNINFVRPEGTGWK